MNQDKIIELYAGPFSKWGTEKIVYSMFGENAGCKISVFENNTNGNIRIQIRYSTNNSTLDWIEYLEDTYISAQVIYCRVASTSTGGFIKLKIS
jgi:hypothetical protein